MPAPGALFGRIRRLCLSLPEANEVSTWGHPAFKVRNKAFVAFEEVQKRPSIAFRLSRTHVDGLLAQEGFFATPYGRGLWVSRWADAPVNAHQLDALVVQAYRLVAGVRLNALLGDPQVPPRRRQPVAPPAHTAQRPGAP